MKEEKRKAPKLRFPGFDGYWEERKLSDMCSLITKQTGFDYSSSIKPSLVTEAGEDTYPFIQNKDFDGEDINLHTDFYIPISVAEKFPKITLDTPSLLISISGKIGNVGYYRLKSKAFIGGAIGICKLLEDNGRLLVYALQSDVGKHFFHSLIKASSHANITVEDIRNITLCLPKSEEEYKLLEDFLHNLDTLISLYQGKLNQIKEYKKGMLQKMFPKKGETVPEVRFPGFEGDWEERKVTELGKIYIGLVTTMTSHYTDHGALLIRNSDIKEGRFEFGDHPIYLDDIFAEQNASRKHRLGDVITVHTGDIGTSAIITEKEVGSIGFATIVTRPDTEIITSEYLCAYLNTDTHKNFAMNISTGDGRNNYNLKDYYECVIPIPRLEEQKKISGFINGLNNHITLYQRKLEQMKEYKKGLLQQMFV